MDFLNNEKNRELGSHLLKRRQELNLDLDELSEETGIPIQRLKQFEDGDFKRFDPFYLKMYLKKYASALSLDIQELYQLYGGRKTDSRTDVDKLKKQSAPKPKKVSRRKRTNYHLGKIIGLFFALIVVVLGIIYAVDMVRSWNEVRENDPPVIVNPTPPEPEDNDEDYDSGENNEELEEPEEPEEIEPEPTTTIEKEAHEGNIQTFAVGTQLEAIELVIRFSSHCWVGGNINGNMLNISRHAGDVFEESFTFTDEATIVLNIGNLPGIEEITINGEAVAFESGGAIVQDLIFNITSR